MDLAMKMRPKNIDDIIGQPDITKEDSIIRKMIEGKLLKSIILYGPPGTGKTSIATVIAENTNTEFHKVNAVESGKKDVEKVIAIAKENLKEDKQTILFIDEIHRFNKAQQDYLLPYIEDGTIVLIGATTENPLFSVNSAIVSRCSLFQLNPIAASDIKLVLHKAIEKYYNDKLSEVSDDVLEVISDLANSDIRQALNILELCFSISESVTLDTVKTVIQKPNLQYDKDGTNHYDTISAFIKSIRGSDPNATEYYLAKMLESGEDPIFIARRIVIAASEDIGNADPQAITVATSAFLATEKIGMPEARIILSQAALYLAMAPKCNTAKTSIDNAIKYIHKHPNNTIPEHLRAPHYTGDKHFEHCSDYLYPHDYQNGWCKQRYLPDGVNERFYHNSHIGYEDDQATYQNNIRKSSK